MIGRTRKKKNRNEKSLLYFNNFYLFYSISRYFMFPMMRVYSEQIFRRTAVVDCSCSGSAVFHDRFNIDLHQVSFDLRFNFWRPTSVSWRVVAVHWSPAGDVE